MGTDPGGHGLAHLCPTVTLHVMGTPAPHPESGHDLPALLPEPRDQSATCCHGVSLRRVGPADPSAGCGVPLRVQVVEHPWDTPKMRQGCGAVCVHPGATEHIPRSGAQVCPCGCLPRRPRSTPSSREHPPPTEEAHRESSRQGPFRHVLVGGEATGAFEEVPHSGRSAVFPCCCRPHRPRFWALLHPSLLHYGNVNGATPAGGPAPPRGLHSLGNPG